MFSAQTTLSFADSLRSCPFNFSRVPKIDLDDALKELLPHREEISDYSSHLSKNTFAWLKEKVSDMNSNEVKVTNFFRIIFGDVAMQRSDLQLAVEGEFVDAVRSMLKQDFTNPNQVYRKHSPLNIAVFQGFEKIVEILLNDKRTDPNLSDNGGYTALCIAVGKENIRIIQLLLDLPQIDPNRPGFHDDPRLYDREGSTALGIAVGKGNIQIMQLLLNHPQIDPNRPGFHDDTPLLNAVDYAIEYHNMMPLKELMSDRRTKIKLACKGRLHPFFIAASRGINEIIDLILQHDRCDPNLFKLFQPDLLKNSFFKDEKFQVDKMSPFTNGLSRLKVYEDNSSYSTKWVKIGFLPISNDPLHRPTAEFLKEVEVVSSNRVRSKNYGEIEIVQIKREGGPIAEYSRIVYRTANYVAMSVLCRNQPYGPTIYQPRFSLNEQPRKERDKLKGNGQIWHIASRSISPENEVIRAIFNDLIKEKQVVFRHLKKGEDDNSIVQSQPLRGYGRGTSIPKHVENSKNSSLVSTSQKLVSCFANGSCGYAAIFTKEGSQLFLGYNHRYPRFSDYDTTSNAVSGDKNLLERVQRVKEAIFIDPIPLEIVVLVDDGYPTSTSENKKKKAASFSDSNEASENPKPKVPKLPKGISRFLNREKVSFDELSNELKGMLTSNKSQKNKLREIKSFLDERKNPKMEDDS